MGLPVVGSTKFRELSFKSQLEIISLKLFDPDEYARQAGLATSDAYLGLQLDYPPLPEIALADMPVAFLEHYWAGYSCAFKKEWYGDNLFRKFGIECRRMVNIWTFNFSFISLEPSIQYIMKWLMKFKLISYCGSIVLLHACKILMHLEKCLIKDRLDEFRQDPFKESKKASEGSLKIYDQALVGYNHLFKLADVNDYYPLMEDINELDMIDHQLLLVHPTSRPRDSRWFYPLIPVKMYNVDSKFHIYNWDFLT